MTAPPPPHAWLRHRASGALALLVVAALVLTACGKGSLTSRGSAAVAAARGSGVPTAAVTVIKGWADALRNGRPQRAAAYWAHPSEMLNGPDSTGHLTIVRIRNERQALIADETLPCGATLRRTTSSGPYVRAEFTLGARSGGGANSSGCSGPAGVDFLIHNGHIVRWLRAPVGSSPPLGGGGSGGGGSGGGGSGGGGSGGESPQSQSV